MQRLTLASLGSPKTPADSDLARSAREALVGRRFAQGESDGSGSERCENGSDSTQPEPPAVQLLR
ncbi:hypothetical protein TYRP_009990 [Tyrophagus putrescentiae]|nr:hypothetical protein TYRP_020915 [Tyrophagus putrescentiae]KAH9410234.1 hypothetical protein TYRP_009990 [Tyrophagus putrescentiae]